MTTKPALSDAKRQLLERMMRGEGRDQAAPVAPVTPRPANVVIPLSADQRQIWLHAAMAPDAPLYNESITIHRLGSCDLDALRRAVNEILRRHEAWRTGFEMIDGELAQIVHPHQRLDIPLSDVSHLPEAERDAAALALGSDDARKAIDLADAPLFRARIVKLAEDNHRLYFTLSHLIFDGVSIYRIIVPELATLYEAFAAGKPSPLPEPLLQYGDYSVWQQRYLESAPVKRQLGHWRTALAGAPTKLELASDKPRPVERTHAGSMEVFDIPLALTEALKALSQREGVTLYMVLLAAYKAMLHRYSGEEDIVVGGVTDLRRRPELEQLVGLFLNTIALRSRPRGEVPFKDFLGEVRDSVLGALGASEVPFDMVVREMKIRAEPGAHPLFNLLFTIEPPVDPIPPRVGSDADGRRRRRRQIRSLSRARRTAGRHDRSFPLQHRAVRTGDDSAHDRPLVDHHFDQWRRLPAARRRRYMRDRFEAVIEILGLRPAVLSAEPRALRISLDRAAHVYRPSAYGGDIVLFQPAERPDVLDSVPGWKPLISGRFVAYEIPGTHSLMVLHPHVETFGDAMRDELLRAQSSRSARNRLRAVG